MMQTMQATMVTFGRTPITLVGAINLASGVLTIIGPTPKSLRTRNQGAMGAAAFVTDDWRADDFDGLFSHAHVADAVMEMRSMQAQDLLVLDEKAQRWDMGSVVAFDGMDDTGKPKIRLSPNAENAHVAILAMCWLSKSLMVAEHVAGAGQRLVEQSGRGQDTVFRPSTGSRLASPGSFGGSYNPHNIVKGTGLFAGLFFFGSQPPGGE